MVSLTFKKGQIANAPTQILPSPPFSNVLRASSLKLAQGGHTAIYDLNLHVSSFIL